MPDHKDGISDNDMLRVTSLMPKGMVVGLLKKSILEYELKPSDESFGKVTFFASLVAALKVIDEKGVEHLISKLAEFKEKETAEK